MSSENEQYQPPGISARVRVVSISLCMAREGSSAVISTEFALPFTAASAFYHALAAMVPLGAVEIIVRPVKNKNSGVGDRNVK
jgi:hypothetical protein